MKTFAKLFFLLLSFKTVGANSQSVIKIDTSIISKYRNTQRLDYRDENGKVYGAGFSLEGLNTIVVFNSIAYNKKNNQLYLNGTTYETMIGNPFRAEGVAIFIAKPYNHTLSKRKTLGYSSKTSIQKNRVGDFKVSFKVSDGYKLYFNGGSGSYLLEYDIPRLMSELKSHEKRS
jgi:hypothetical protein